MHMSWGPACERPWIYRDKAANNEGGAFAERKTHSSERQRNPTTTEGRQSVVAAKKNRSQVDYCSQLATVVGSLKPPSFTIT